MALSAPPSLWLSAHLALQAFPSCQAIRPDQARGLSISKNTQMLDNLIKAMAPFSRN